MASPPRYSKSDLDLLERLAQEQSRRSFWAFRQYMHPGLIKGWWQREIARELMQFADDLIAGKRPILLIMAPPQHGKSVQIVDFIAWLSGHHPHLRTIYASFSERLGVRANLMFQRMALGTRYPATFPAIQIGGGATKNRELVEFADQEGYFRNTTVGGPVTGEGLDLGVIDDPVKGREEANSQTIRDKTWDWFTDDFFSRFSDKAGLLGIMTRWHIDDPFGRLIEKFGDRVKVLRYPALAEHDEPHRGEGAPLFPEHKTLDFLEERRGVMAAANWQALYQQNPIILGGNLFRDEWWQYYTATPPLKWRALYADTAQKTKQQNDYTVLQCWGESWDGRAVLVDQLRGKWEAPDLLTHARAFWNKHKGAPRELGALRRFCIEDKVSGTGLIQTLRREGIPVKEIQRDVDKYTRALDGSPYVEAGRVLLPANAPWLSEYLAEFAAFPNGVHDDQVDPTLDAIEAILGARATVDYSKLV